MIHSYAEEPVQGPSGPWGIVYITAGVSPNLARDRLKHILPTSMLQAQSYAMEVDVLLRLALGYVYG